MDHRGYAGRPWRGAFATSQARRSALACLFASLAWIAPLEADETRTWTDITGKHQTVAEYVSCEDGVVTLRKPGTNKTVKMPLERLSLEDQQHVRELLDAAAAPKTDSFTEDSDAAEGEPVASATRPAGPRSPSSGNVVNSVRGAVLRSETSNHMKQLALALLNYESTNGRFPKAAAFQAADGSPGLSWRVAILPLLEENALYDQFRKNEPWDSPHNRQLIARMPAVFKSPGAKLEEGYTNYLAVVAPNTILSNGRRGTSTRDITDGTSRTVMLVEADDDAAVPWTKPDDLAWDSQQPLRGLGQIWSGRFYAVFGDGSVRAIGADLPAETINGLFSRNGGEVITIDE